MPNAKADVGAVTGFAIEAVDAATFAFTRTE
jgi:hypothetical protein